MRKTIILLLTILSFSLVAQKSSVAFTLSETDLLPESIAHDPNTNSFFVGSTRRGKIVKIDGDGTESTFIKSGEFGQWMIIGIKVDAQRNELWFCSSGGNNLGGYSLKEEVDGRPAGIFKVDLNTGMLKKKYTLETKGEIHFFNDLVLDENGDVYASHMFAESSIYKIDRVNDILELFSSDARLSYPNGLTISDDRKNLFVAHSGGIAKISLKTGNLVSLNLVNNVELTRRASADGLYFFEGNLIAIQPDLSQVAQYRLSRPEDAIMEGLVLEKNHPKMDHPTTGVLVGADFYYVANAQFEKVGKDGSLAISEVSVPVILKLILK